METNETYRLYLRDLVYLLKEYHNELKNESGKDDFRNGIEFGYSSIIDLIESQSEVFQIDISEFGFSDFKEFIKNQN